MTPAEARQALLDALTVERFTAYVPPRPYDADASGRLFAATREAARVVCRGCGSSVTPDEPCAYCAATREARARRARLRAVGRSA